MSPEEILHRHLYSLLSTAWFRITADRHEPTCTIDDRHADRCTCQLKPPEQIRYEYHDNRYSLVYNPDTDQIDVTYNGPPVQPESQPDR